jgi:hypothetical protein
MIKSIFLILITSILISNEIYSSDYNNRVKYNFNSSWKLFVGDTSGAEKPEFDDIAWKQVTLPYAYNQEESFKKAIHELTTGICWYRKHFKLPAEAKNKKIFIEFEGIRQGGEFYINGKYVGLHENGVMAFGFDITNFVKNYPEENVIAVRIDNSWKYKEKATGTTFQWNNNNFNANYGGIPKNVILHITGKLYQTLPLYSFLGTSGIYIYATNFNIKNKSADITVQSEIKNEYNKDKEFTLNVEIFDIKGQKIAAFSSEKQIIKAGETKIVKIDSEVKNLEFWSWGYGYLYDVISSIRINNKTVDAVKIKTGFRKTEFKNGIIFLNDRAIQMKGYAQRTSNEWPATGMSVPAWISDFSNRMIVESNGNLVRWMHVTPWKQDVESCDRVGLIQAMPAGDAESDAKGRQWEQRLELMRDAIIYNRNNPSILFYECGNENISEDHMRQMKEIRDKYDPYGGRAIGAREMLDSKEAEYGGEMLYINKSANIPMWAMEYMRDEALRKYWDEYSYPYHKNGEGPLYHNQDASAYNQNQDSYAVECIRRWYDYWRERAGTGKRVSSGGVNIIFSDSNTHFRGAENYRRSGEVDALRIAKDAYFVHQAIWDGWVDNEKHHTYIIGHWNYTDSTIKNVYVASTADKVELFINNKSQGFGERNYNFLFTFKNIKWQKGSIKAIGYDQNNNILSTCEKKSAGNPVAIKLTPHINPNGFKADGADIAILDVEVIDSDGNRCPIANNIINFNLTGEGIWLGGIAQGPDNYILSKSLPVECGINRVLIKSTEKAGKINIIATSENLKESKIEIQTLPVDQINGLSRSFPSDNLPYYLDRGPTPLSNSFKISRRTIDIAKVTAGANQNDTYKSYDDNELTEWTNDGKISTGWIKYEFMDSVKIDEISMKLTGWRSRSYPLTIFVDSTEVFKGETEKSLGYITIPIKSTKGKSVTIRLTGSNTENDAFGQIVEITGTKELDLLKDPSPQNAINQLRIVEIEFYEKL